MKKLIRKLPVVITVIVVTAFVVYGFRPLPVEVDVTTVGTGSFDITINDDGVTRIREKYIVSAPVSGKLHRIELEPGDVVEQNETIVASLDPGDPTLLDKRATAQAQARLRGAKAASELARTRLQRAAEALKLAEQNFNRADALNNRKAMATSDYDRMKQQLEIARADVRSGEFGVQVADFEAELAQAALIRTQSVEEQNRTLQPGESLADPLAAFSIRSPISGRVLRVLNEDAGVVALGTRLVELGDPRDLEMQIDVLSSEAVRIQPGAKVYVDHWGGDEPLTGTVRIVEPAAFIKVSALGVEEHRVNVIADFHGLLQCQQTLGDGFRIETRIVVESVQNAVVVPTGVLFRSGDGWAAYRVRDKRARLCRVKVGRTNGLQSEILDGLKPGDQVILHPTEKVEDSVTVLPHRK